MARYETLLGQDLGHSFGVGGATDSVITLTYNFNVKAVACLSVVNGAPPGGAGIYSYISDITISDNQIIITFSASFNWTENISVLVTAEAF